MSWTSAYSSEIAFWHALRRRAAEQAKTTRVLQPELLRMFVMQRFMARMFENPSAPWIVAGGTNLLIRIPGARSTRDIDLNTPSENYGTLDSIRSDLEPLTGENFELDPFDFTLDQKVGTFTGGLQGSNWRITATIAGQRAAVFGLDLAADDTTKVSEIERREVTPAISDMPGLRPRPRCPSSHWNASWPTRSPVSPSVTCSVEAPAATAIWLISRSTPATSTSMPTNCEMRCSRESLDATARSRCA